MPFALASEILLRGTVPPLKAMEFAGRGLAHGRREVRGEAVCGGHRSERKRRCEGSGAVWNVNKHGGRGGRGVLKKKMRGVRNSSQNKNSPR
jgi:hypothetical protein